MLEAGAMPMVALTGLESLTLAAGGHHFQSANTTVLVLGGRSLDLLNAASISFVLTVDWFSSDHERFDHWDCFQRCHVYY